MKSSRSLPLLTPTDSKFHSEFNEGQNAPKDASWSALSAGHIVNDSESPTGKIFPIRGTEGESATFASFSLSS